MSEAPWVDRTIAGCLNESFAGEWGSNPDPANAFVLRATDIDDDGHIVGGGARRQIPQTKLRAKRLQPGDILLEGSGGGPDKPVGRVALFQDATELPSVCSNFFKTLRPNGEVVDARYLWRKLGWFYRQPALLALQQQTTGIINLKFAGYLATVLNLPESADEQAKIAAVLDTLDAAIRQTEAIIAKLKQVKQGLLHDLLTRGIDANGELRPTQSQAPHLYKQSPLGWIPKEWAVNTGNDVCREIVVGIVVRPTQYYKSEGVPVLRSANVRESGLSLDGLVFMNRKDHLSQSKSAVSPGDVLTVRTGYPGTTCVVDERVDEANCVDVIISRPGDSISPHFFALWINSSFGKEQVLKVQGGLAQQHFNVGELAAMLVATPSLREQSAVVERLASMSKKIAAEESSAMGYRDLKSGLMDDLLTGRVRVNPLLEATATP